MRVARSAAHGAYGIETSLKPHHDAVRRMVGREDHYGNLFLDEEHDFLNISSTLFHGSTQKATNREALGEIAKHELHEVQRVVSKTLQLDPKHTKHQRKYTFFPRKQYKD